MDVSIIFVNYKTKDMTINAIKSVIEKTEGIEYEIFVVDNNSQDNSIEAIEQTFPNINIIKNSVNAGFGAANNLAIKHARGKYVFCLNTDTLLINNAIKIMFDFMEKEENKKVGVCGGYLVDSENKPAMCGGHFPSIKDTIFKTGLRKIFPNYYKNFSIVLYSNDSKYIENIEYIIGADIFFRKSVLDEVGAFDEQFFMYSEESDLCKRIKNTGYDVKFVENARIMHLEQGSTKNKIVSRKRAKNSEFKYYKKHKKYQLIIIKILYLIIFEIDWLITKNNDSKELFIYILNNCEDK